MTPRLHVFCFTLSLAVSCLAADSKPAAANDSVAGAPAADTRSLTTQIDEDLGKMFKPDAPGAAVLVVRRGEVVLRKGYGLANVELNVPMQPEHIFRLGSITKQFTAVAILQLLEAGRLTLEDDITTYVPDVETGSVRVTLRHLLNHTSGLPSFTDQLEFRRTLRKDMTLADVLAAVKGRPAHFTPGTDWRYCNSGFYLLGAVIEKITGQTYAAYLDEHVFKPAGMMHSFYDETEKVIPLRVPGYTIGRDNQVANATFVSMTQPQGAGGLMSNVDDLWKWEQALASGKLLKPESLAQAYANVTLPDGRATGYGFGWGLGTYQGHSVIEHAGGIQGFVTKEIRIPDADIYIVVLCNTDRTSAAQAAPGKILSHLLGPPQPLKPETLPVETLQSRVAVYRMSAQRKIAFEIAGDRLQVRGSRGFVAPLVSVTADRFTDASNDTWYTFVGAFGNRPRVLEHTRGGPEAYGTLVDEPLIDPEKPAVALPPEILERYVGTYELAKDFALTIRNTGSALTAQATGQPSLDLIAETPTHFRVKQVPAEINFKLSAEDAVIGLVLRQNGIDQPAKKVK